MNAVSNFNLMKAPHVQLATKSEGMYPLSVSVVYVGSLVNGEPDGKGTAYDTSTRLAVYDGEFKHGQYNGRGKRYFNGKLIEEGDFVNGLLTSGIRHNANGLLECGPFVSNKLSGMGRYVFPNGFYISGSFPAMENMHNAYLAAIPSAKNPTNFVIGATPAQKRSFFFKDGVFISEQEGRGFLFYYNGDVFIGEIEETRPKNGMMFKLSGNEFVKMTVGTVLVSLPYKQPIIRLEKEYKYFEMIWSVCWIMI